MLIRGEPKCALRAVCLFSISLCWAPLVRAQENYEIQVYAAETVAPKRTMVELHSNFTVSGSKDIVEGMIPTEHAFHETLEITQGWNEWFETGLYVFSSINRGY